MSLIEEGCVFRTFAATTRTDNSRSYPQHVRMAFLAVIGSHKVNGVAELHSGLVKVMFHDFVGTSRISLLILRRVLTAILQISLARITCESMVVTCWTCTDD